MTYGDIASISGQANAARVVGGIAHFGDPNLPWHRVVNRYGGLADGYYGGKHGHRVALEFEGVHIEDFKIVNFQEHRWIPNFH